MWNFDLASPWHQHARLVAMAVKHDVIAFLHDLGDRMLRVPAVGDSALATMAAPSRHRLGACRGSRRIGGLICRLHDLQRNPWPVSLYGWEGRQDGVLALFGVAILLAAAASLRPPEVGRLYTWLPLAGSILVIEAMLQLAGWEGFRTSEIEGVWAAMANPNFLAAMCGMLAALALARVCDRRYSASQRIAVGVLLAGLIAASILTMSAHGPATLLVAFAAVLALGLLQWRGPQRIWVAVGLGAGTVVGLGLKVLGLFGIGPVTRVWVSQQSGAFRKSFWDVGWRFMETVPAFGTSPGGLSRYVGDVSLRAVRDGTGSRHLH